MGLQNLSHLFEFQKKKMTFPVQNSTLLKMHQQESFDNSWLISCIVCFYYYFVVVVN